MSDGPDPFLSHDPFQATHHLRFRFSPGPSVQRQCFLIVAVRQGAIVTISADPEWPLPFGVSERVLEMHESHMG